MNKDDFHVPFIKSLLVVAIVTVVSMTIANYFISDRFFPGSNSSSFTVSKSYPSSK